MDTFWGLAKLASITYSDFRNQNGGHVATETEWADKVKGLLKAELKRRNVSYKQLAEKLDKVGIRESEANIKNKISRGGFSAVFFVQCLSAIGCHHLHISLDEQPDKTSV